MCNAFNNVQTSIDDSFDTSSMEDARQATEQTIQKINKMGLSLDDATTDQEEFN